MIEFHTFREFLELVIVFVEIVVNVHLILLFPLAPRVDPSIPLPLHHDLLDVVFFLESVPAVPAFALGSAAHSVVKALAIVLQAARLLAAAFKFLDGGVSFFIDEFLQPVAVLDVLLDVLVLLDVVDFQPVFALGTEAHSRVAFLAMLKTLAIGVFALAVLAEATIDFGLTSHSLYFVSNAIVAAKAIHAHLVVVIVAWAEPLEAVGYAVAFVPKEPIGRRFSVRFHGFFLHFI